MREIRRKDRIMEESDALGLLAEGEYGFLALQDTGGGGYGIPLNYVLEDRSVYFHCAPEGHKLKCLETCNRASFCVVGKTRVIPECFSTAYQSAMIFGTVTVVSDDVERRRALDLLVGKYSAAYRDIAAKYIAGSFARTCILRFDIDETTAKCKRIKVDTNCIIK